MPLRSSLPGRTFPTHPYFQAQLGAGQLSLYNILKAYSLLDPEVLLNSVFALFLPFSSFILHVSFDIQWKKGRKKKASCCLSFRLERVSLPCVVGIKFVVVVFVGGILPGPVLHRWSAAFTHGGRRRLRHAQISNVRCWAPQTVQA